MTAAIAINLLIIVLGFAFGSGLVWMIAQGIIPEDKKFQEEQANRSFWERIRDFGSILLGTVFVLGAIACFLAITALLISHTIGGAL